ncbi:MAG: branched-chain amino acid ABC transporter permease, partial [Deltaproteobacteria bacterium]|nr:branched-chain amino acid ABC transporter permease [Deltaproteobacteria bacterium]
IMLGAYLGFFLTGALSSFSWALIISGVIIGILGALIEFFLIRRLYGNELFQLLLTFGLIFILDETVKLIWGPGVIPVEKPDFLQGSVIIYGEPFTLFRVFILSAGAVVCLLIFLLLKKTRLGLIIRAGIENKEMVRALGININRVFTLVCWISGFLAGVAGLILAGFTGLNPEMGFNQIINILVIVVVGGLGSFMGTAVAAIIIGLTESFVGFFLPEFAMISIFIVMFTVLSIKPSGLFGER